MDGEDAWEDSYTPREPPRRQDSAISSASSGGKTARPSSAGSRSRQRSTPTGGIFARLRGASQASRTNNDGDGSSGEDTPSEAGPSDWYRRSPTPDSLPKAWRQASPAQDYGIEDGPSDVWGRSESPIGQSSPRSMERMDEKVYIQRLEDQSNADEEEMVSGHPADVSVERGSGQAPVDATDGDSEISTQVISPSPSSMSLNDRPFPTRSAALVPAISRLRSHHRSISSTTQQSLRPYHSRTPSQFSQLSTSSEPITPKDPALTFHPLRQLSAEVKQKRPTVVDVRGMIAVGTETGHILIYTFAQELKHTLAMEATLSSGAVTAICISPDQTYIAAGHASGNIHLWDLATPNKPARTTLALTPEQLKTGRKDGHARGDAIQHVGFVAARHTAIVSGDAAGKAFWWSLGRVMGIDSNDVMRILGSTKRSKLFAALPLPLGEVKHPTDASQISAMLTPRKLMVVCMKPVPKTLHRRLGEGATGCAAWLRPGELSSTSDPVLAYSWDQRLHFLRVPSFLESRSYEAPSSILALRWFDPNHILVILQASIVLLDVRTNTPVEDVPFQSSMVQNMSVSTYREKVFILTKASLQAGTLKYWNDIILTCVHKGDFLGAIHLAIAYYKGTATGNFINLPDKPAIARRIRELVTASLNWAFSEERMRDDTHYSADGRGVDLTSLFEGLAQSSVESCLTIEDMDLFETTYDAFERAGIQGIFLAHLEPFVLDNKIKQVPPGIVKAIIGMHEDRGEYDAAEALIWSVDPLSLDINQAVTMCERHSLWDALIHVYIQALFDYVTPITKLLGPRIEPTLVYAYLEAILSGVSYPSGESLPDPEKAQSQVYDAIFGDYLTHLLVNTELFLHVLDLAFEHLDDSASISRQAIVNILLDRASSDLFVQIFVSRNLPKYPQFIVLPPSTLDRLLRNLASGEDDTREDRQMATEYLLSAYKPHDYDSILELFDEAGFTRILGRHYRRERKWRELAMLIIRDQDTDLFEDLDDIFKNDSATISVLDQSWSRILKKDISRTAILVDRWSPSLHDRVISSLDDMDQLYYLQQLLEPDHSFLTVDHRHRYIALLRQYNPHHVLDYLEHAKDLDIPRLAIECERGGFVEGQLWALERQGDPATFDIAGNIIRQQGSDLYQAVSSGDYEHILVQLEETSKMAVRLGQKRPTEDNWFAILQPIIETIQSISSIDKTVSAHLRGLIQSTLLHLISSGISFPRLFKRLVDETSGNKTSYAEFRTILTGMLDSYRAEGEMLLMSKRLMEADLFVAVEELSRKRQCGWNPASRICRCGKEVTDGVIMGTGQMLHTECRS